MAVKPVSSLYDGSAANQRSSGLVSDLARRAEQFKDEVFQLAIQKKSRLYQRGLFRTVQSGTWQRRGDHIEFGPRTPYLQYQASFVELGASRKVATDAEMKKTNIVRAAYDRILYHSDIQHAKVVLDRHTNWNTAFDITGDHMMKLSQAKARAMDRICVDGFFDPTFVRKTEIEDGSRGVFYDGDNRNTGDMQGSLDEKLANKPTSTDSSATVTYHGGVGYGYGLVLEYLVQKATKTADFVIPGSTKPSMITGAANEAAARKVAEKESNVFIATGDGSASGWGKYTRHTHAALKKFFVKKDVEIDDGEELISTLTPSAMQHMELEDQFVNQDYGTKKLESGGTLRHAYDYAGVYHVKVPGGIEKKLDIRAKQVLGALNASKQVLQATNVKSGAIPVTEVIASGNTTAASASAKGLLKLSDIGDTWHCILFFTRPSLVTVEGMPGEILVEDADISGPLGQGEKLIYACFDKGAVRNDPNRIAMCFVKEL